MAPKRSGGLGLKRLYRLALVSLLLSICLPGAVPRARAADPGYEISAYNVDISIGGDNVYQINETITVDFSVPSRGIYRYIPLRQEMEWTAGNSVRRVVYNTKVSSVSVRDHPFETYADSGYMVIRIGDPGRYHTGRVVYSISYTHALGNDKIDERDFVYYNLVGTQWDCKISGVSFSVSLPKDFDPERIKFFSGAFGSKAEASVEYGVNDNTINGKLGRSLFPGEGLTMQLDLPEGYFEPPPPFPWQAVFIAASLVSVLASLVFYLLFGRDGPLPAPVEFYPPEGITPAEAGYIIDGTVDDKDVISLVIFWASKGLISIEQTGREDLRLVKLNNLTDTAHDYEKTLFSAVFKGRETVLVSELSGKVYNEVTRAKSQVSQRFIGKGNRLYTRISLFMSKLSVFTASLLILSSLFVALYRLFYSAETALILSLAGTLIAILPISSLRRILIQWNAIARAKRSALLAASLIGAAALLAVYSAFMYTQEMLLCALFISAAALFLGITGVYMRKRTRRGSELLGRILGFKNFLEAAEKERLELLSQDNPSYFYDILPYAYVFGISEKWAKKFEGIALSPPPWYTGYGGVFSPLMFNLMMLNSLTAMQGAMTARPVATRGGFVGGGGFGGGGFAGGGFGGGGGGRW